MCQKLIDILDDAPKAGLTAQAVMKQINLLDTMHIIKGTWTYNSNYPELLEKGEFTFDEPENVIISLPPPPLREKEEFRNWVSIDDDVLTIKESTEKYFTEELVFNDTEEQ